jgi:hypothetical protein
MQKWEYAFVDLVQTPIDDEPDEVELYLKLPNEDGRMIENSTVADTVNMLGESGWEVVGYASPVMTVERFVLKRAKAATQGGSAVIG